MKRAPFEAAALQVVVPMLILLLGGCSASASPDDAGSPSAIDAGSGDPTVDEGPYTCGDGAWDHDGDPATACVAWTACEPGTYVTHAPSATADRQCAGCPSGTFSATSNAAGCTTWSNCAAGRS